MTFPPEAGTSITSVSFPKYWSRYEMEITCHQAAPGALLSRQHSKWFGNLETNNCRLRWTHCIIAGEAEMCSGAVRLRLHIEEASMAPWHLAPWHLAPWHLAPWHLAPWLPGTLAPWYPEAIMSPWHRPVGLGSELGCLGQTARQLDWFTISALFSDWSG